MKAFIVEQKIPFYSIHPDVEDEKTIYTLCLANTKEEITFYRKQNAYEIPKEQTVKTFGFYLAFADNQNTKITKNEKGFDISFDISKETQEEIKTGLKACWVYVKRNLLALDQVANTLLRGYEDETLSSRFYRWSLRESFWWKLPCKVIDTLFFFDYRFDEDGRKMLHCEKAFENELKRTGLPIEMR